MVPRAVLITAIILPSVVAAQVGSAFSARRMTPAVKCGRLVDVKTGAIMTNVVVALDGQRIKEVVPNGTLPEGGIDLGASTCLPGLIDVHTHLAHRYRRDLPGGGVKILAETAMVSPASRALIGVRLGLEDLEAGITTVRDLGNSGFNIAVALRNAINAGDVPGPRILAATRALSSARGQFPPLEPHARGLIEQEYDVINGTDDARRAVREAVYSGADVIKIIASRLLSVGEMKAIVEEAHRVNRRVAAHAFGELVIGEAVDAGVDSIEHGVAGVPEGILQTMAKKGIYMVPTGVSIDEDFRDIGKLPVGEQPAAWANATAEFRNGRYAVGIRKAMAAGVRIAMGADIYGDPIPPVTRGTLSLATMYGYVDAGMTPLQALQTATIHAADLLGWSDRVGTIAPGRFADLIAVDGDPMTDIRAIKKVWFVMKGGAVMRNDRQR